MSGNSTYLVPVASNGSASNSPRWFLGVNWGNLASGVAGNVIQGVSSNLFGDSAVGLLIGNTVGNLGSLVGSSIVSNLISGNKLGANLNNINFSQQGYGLAGGLLGSAIGGDAGLAVGTAVSGIPTITNAVKGIQTFNKAKNALKAGLTMSKAAKLGLLGNFASIGGLAASVADSFLDPKSEYAGEKGKVTLGMDMAYDAVTAAANAIPVAGNLISGLMAINRFAGDGLNALGLGTDGMTTQDAILGSAFFNNTLLGRLNGAFGKTTRDFNMREDDWNLVGSAYQDSENNANYAATRAGKKYGMLSSRARKRANKAIDRANTEQFRISDIASEDEIRDLIYNTMTPYYQFNALNLINGGNDYYSQYAKFGAKLQRAKDTLSKASSNKTSKFKEGGNISQKPDNWEPELWYSEVDNWEPELWDVEEFKTGGKMNLIPEGALHARLHHMNLEGITKKGIPVITEENGKVIQHAEIELNEIVFTLEVTQKIEELMKDGSDAAAIEAGKLLAEEIIDNTDDRTGLLLE